MYTSPYLRSGEVYTRQSLKQQFNIADQTLYTGIFKPAGYNSMWLFVTEQKSADAIAYSDRLEKDCLHWDGQMSGRKDHLIIEHERAGIELLVFYRAKKLEFPGAGFRFEGQFRYDSHTGANPAHFILRRMHENL